jgi:hypothetical protein
MHDYQVYQVKDMKEMMRGIRIRSKDWPPHRDGFITRLLKWDQENAPDIAANHRVAANGPKKGPRKTTPTPAQALAAANSKESRKRKQTSPPVETVSKPKRQRTAMADDDSGNLEKTSAAPGEASSDGKPVRSQYTQKHKAKSSTQVRDDTQPRHDEDVAMAETVHENFSRLTAPWRSRNNAHSIIPEEDEGDGDDEDDGEEAERVTGKGSNKRHVDRKTSRLTSKMTDQVPLSEDNRPGQKIHSSKDRVPQSTRSNRATSKDRPFESAARKSLKGKMSQNITSSKTTNRTDITARTDFDVDGPDAGSTNNSIELEESEWEDDEVTTERSPRAAPKTKKGKNKNEHAQPEKTAEELAKARAEHQRKLHLARPLGTYSDPKVAEAWRVKNRTIKLKMDHDMRPGEERALMDQLGTWRWTERYLEKAKEEGREVRLWMSGDYDDCYEEDRERSEPEDCYPPAEEVE